MAAGAATAGLLTAACSSTDSVDGRTTAGAAARGARTEGALRLRSAGLGQKLLARYDAVLEQHPGQRERLAPLRGAVARQVAALMSAAGTAAGTPEKPSASGSPPASSAPSGDRVRSAVPDSVPASARASTAAAATAPAAGRSGVAVAADPAAALKDLAAAERRTSDAHTATLMEASPEFARLLASLAAASAAHAYLLTEGARS